MNNRFRSVNQQSHTTMSVNAPSSGGSGGLQNYERIRARMIDRLRQQGIGDERVLAAMQEVPRHLFISEALRGRAYGDHAVPIEGRQTISQPYIVARQTELLELKDNARVLEIGAGSGYQTAVLAKLVRQVFAIERLPELAKSAQNIWRELHISNVTFRCADGTIGWPEYAPYDGILVAAGSPEIPEPLVTQLAIGAHLIIPVGDEREQRLLRVTRTHIGKKVEDCGGCQFVKLVGRHAWKTN
jgi:protein-L-isoaspartate(D-aspartate) O-methyltransferase